MVKNMPEAEIISEYIFAYEYLQNTNLGNLDFWAAREIWESKFLKKFTCMCACCCCGFFFEDRYFLF